jgi:hypothetical protein
MQPTYSDAAYLFRCSLPIQMQPTYTDAAYLFRCSLAHNGAAGSGHMRTLCQELQKRSVCAVHSEHTYLRFLPEHCGPSPPLNTHVPTLSEVKQPPVLRPCT